MTDFGRHVRGVGANGDAPANRAYSNGPWRTLRGPGVCVFGLRVETTTPIVNTVGAAIRDGHQAAIRPVHPRWYTDFLGAGIDFHQAPPLPITRLFRPDGAGRFPWEEEAEEHCRASRPLFWVPRSGTAGPWSGIG
ncbi:DUF4262 domain-containing protein [Streptomyces sp. DH37]|uniref:DUF4262 domain-containing protein n=1 Tax=Streptomyces sp. DH37 TaxID=3040122 RepID=UPI0024433C9B|nr:DUF4262 domain-containing protein [Streptomyces sp. DH37]MDG9704920.1 DUF4262 domain-containing protein [Streptomyces sp. DH37]